MLKEIHNLTRKRIRIKMEQVLSVSYSNDESLKSISKIFLGGKSFELDPTYSKGVFYNNFPEPKYKSDLIPQKEGVIKMDCRNLNFKESSLKSIIFDPPFLFRNQKSNNNDKMCVRFSYFKNFKELLEMYESSLKEFYRVLEKNGILVFKCQDMTGGSGSRPFFNTHSKIIEMAGEIGFVLKDIQILVTNRKIIRKAKEQGCFRKVHSYFLIFKKQKKHNYKDSGFTSQT